MTRRTEHAKPAAVRDLRRPFRVRLLMLTGIAIVLSGCTSTATTPTTTTTTTTSPDLATASLAATPNASPGAASAGNGSTAAATPESSSVIAAPTSPTDSENPANDTRTAFINAADGVCGDAEHQLNALPAPVGPADLVDSLKAQLQVQQDTLTRLQQLSPPEADRAEISARLLDPYGDAIGRQQSLLPTIENVVTSGDHVQLATIHTEYDDASHPQSVAAFVRDYGFHTCQTYEYFRTP